MLQSFDNQFERSTLIFRIKLFSDLYLIKCLDTLVQNHSVYSFIIHKVINYGN